MSWRDCGDKVGIHNTAFHQIDGGVIKVVTQPIKVEILGDIGQSGGPQRVFASQALMLEVMDGVAAVSYTHLDVYKRQAIPPPGDKQDYRWRF